MRRVFMVVLLGLLSAACLRAPLASKAQMGAGFRASDFRDRDRSQPQEQKRHPSSLWVENHQGNYLFSDHKARRINDVVTVNIIEQSDAEAEVETKSDKSSTLSAGLSGLLGFERVAARRNPNMKLDTLIGAKTSTKFTGKGETTRSGKLVASMSCLVVDVLPNGNLFIRGQRRLRLNDEEIIMVLSGIVRPRDISADNVIPSTLIADARIEYTGEGVLADKTKPGWFTRAFEKAWPF